MQMQRTYIFCASGLRCTKQHDFGLAAYWLAQENLRSQGRNNVFINGMPSKIQQFQTIMFFTKWIKTWKREVI